MKATSSSRPLLIAAWVAQILAAAILGMAGLSKLTAAPESVALFVTLGAEPWGRLLLGAVELVTAAMLLWPRTALLGGGIGIFLMLGALSTHLFRIGINYGGSPTLFVMALLVLAASTTVVVLRRRV